MSKNWILCLWIFARNFELISDSSSSSYLFKDVSNSFIYLWYSRVYVFDLLIDDYFFLILNVSNTNKEKIYYNL